MNNLIKIGTLKVSETNFSDSHIIEYNVNECALVISSNYNKPFEIDTKSLNFLNELVSVVSELFEIDSLSQFRDEYNSINYNIFYHENTKYFGTEYTDAQIKLSNSGLIDNLSISYAISQILLTNIVTIKNNLI